MLHRTANFDKELHPVTDGKNFGIAVVRDGLALHEIHHKVGTPIGTRPGVQNAGDIRVVHHRNGLSFYLEPLDDTSRIHSQLQDLQCHGALHRLTLFGKID